MTAKQLLVTLQTPKKFQNILSDQGTVVSIEYKDLSYITFNTERDCDAIEAHEANYVTDLQYINSTTKSW